ncbi:MAG: ATP-binding protein [Clostridia bacterium]|nr:ATP-binding protein [Clostridia bacterium]
MYLKRKIDTYLSEWKHSESKKPLIVKGPRQIGKTESIKKFAKENYTSVIEINFVTSEKYKHITAEGYSADAIIKNISLIDPSYKFIPGETLIFFDEIQEYPEIATSLKFFSIDGRFDVICSGSLLGINYKRIESNSVGYKIDYNMYSLDFEEFLWAKGYTSDVVEDIFTHMKELKPFTDLEHSIFSSHFLDFCILGGMPAVVREFIKNKTFEGTLDIQRQLLADYKEDIRKYADGVDQTRIVNVFNSVPVQLAKENKKFQLSKVEKGARFKDYRGYIEWLEDAGMIHLCFCLNNAELPLKGNCDTDKFKIYFCDTGLFVALLDDEAQEDLRANKNLAVYKGALYESIVGEGLVKAGYQLYYYRREDSTLEEDFFVRTAHSLVPIEVKAKNNKAKSLSELIKSEKYSDISYGIKLCAGNIGLENNIYTFPYYCTFLLKRYLKEKN